MDRDYEFLLKSGFLKNRPKEVISDKKVSFLSRFNDLFPETGFGFNAGDTSSYMSEKDIVSLQRLASVSTTKNFIDAGLRVPAVKFIKFHELSHKRLDDALAAVPQSKSAGLIDLLKEVPAKKDPDRKGKLIAKNIFMESYADVMAIHLSSQLYGDDADKLSKFIAKVRSSAKDDFFHDDSARLENLSKLLSSDPSSLKRFKEDRNFAEGIALRVAELNSLAVLRTCDPVKGGKFGALVSAARTAPNDENLLAKSGISIFGTGVSQPSISDVSKKIGESHAIPKDSPKKHDMGH